VVLSPYPPATPEAADSAPRAPRPAQQTYSLATFGRLVETLESCWELYSYHGRPQGASLKGKSPTEHALQDARTVQAALTQAQLDDPEFPAINNRLRHISKKFKDKAKREAGRRRFAETGRAGEAAGESRSGEQTAQADIDIHRGTPCCCPPRAPELP